MSSSFKSISIISSILMLFLCNHGFSSEKFEYKFNQGDTAKYILTINSDVSFVGLEKLARFFSLDNITNNTIIKLQLITEDVEIDGTASMRMVIKTVSTVSIVGDSVIADDGSRWGQYKAGSEHLFKINSRGKITQVANPAADHESGSLLLDRFLPVFPSKGIAEGDSWSDTAFTDIYLTDRTPIEIESHTDYLYKNRLAEKVDSYSTVSYSTEGISSDKQVEITGEGHILFDCGQHLVIENNGEFIINAVVKVSDFGLPIQIDSGLPVQIESVMKLRLE